MLEINNIDYQIAGKKIFENFSFTAKKGEIYHLKGAEFMLVMKLKKSLMLSVKCYFLKASRQFMTELH